MSLWTWLTYPDPAKDATPIGRAAVVQAILGRIPLDAAAGFSYVQLIELWGDLEYLELTPQNARVFEDWARERYVKRRRWTARRDCEKQRAIGMAERILAWDELYPENPYPAFGRIIFNTKTGAKHDCSFYLVKGEGPVLVEDANGRFCPPSENVKSVVYFGGL